jgi:hypothetical protein
MLKRKSVKDVTELNITNFLSNMNGLIGKKDSCRLRHRRLTPTRPSRVFFRPSLQKRLQTIKHTCYSTHARYDMAGRILPWFPPY